MEMIEDHVYYDLLSGVDDKAYEGWMKKAIVPVLKSEGIVEVRAYRNLLGSPQVVVVMLWKSLTDWARLGSTSQRIARFPGHPPSNRYLGFLPCGAGTGPHKVIFETF